MRIEIETTQDEAKKLSAQLTQITAHQVEEEKNLDKRNEEKINKAKTYDLLEDGENNIKKLEALVEAGKNKLINLGNQWEKHRAPLIEKYRDAREKYLAKAVTNNIL